MGRFNPNTAVGIENANDDQRTRPGTNTNPGGGEKGSHIPSGAHSVNDASTFPSLYPSAAGAHCDCRTASLTLDLQKTTRP